MPTKEMDMYCTRDNFSKTEEEKAFNQLKLF